jgi:glycosyltransferase involved in cell wall biosynthesis
VLSTWLFHADLLGLVSATTARVPRIVWNVQCADLELSEHPWLLRASVGLLALASHHPAAIVVNSAAGRTAIERLGYAPRRCELIPSGFDLERFVPGHASRTLVRRDLGLPTDAPIVGLVARYHPMKDHETFIRAAALVHRDRPEVHFVLAGRDVDHGNDSLMKWIHDAKLESHVHCVGLWPHVVELLQALDIACCSSYSEGLPNILGEAMACGVPCVSTDVGDCATLIGDTGYVVPPRDPEAFANALRAFLDRGVDARREAGLAARKRVQDNYDIVGVARKYENLFTDILSQPDAARRPS